MKYIFAKNCIIEIYFAYIFFIKVRYIHQNMFDIYSNAVEIYIFIPKSYICRIYIVFSWATRTLTIISSRFSCKSQQCACATPCHNI